MSNSKLIEWQENSRVAMEVARRINEGSPDEHDASGGGAAARGADGEFDVDVTDAAQIREWVRLLGLNASSEGTQAAVDIPPDVWRSAIRGGVVVSTVTTFAFVVCYAISRDYRVRAQHTANSIRFSLKPPTRP